MPMPTGKLPSDLAELLPAAAGVSSRGHAHGPGAAHPLTLLALGLLDSCDAQPSPPSHTAKTWPDRSVRHCHFLFRLLLFLISSSLFCIKRRLCHPGTCLLLVDLLISASTLSTPSEKQITQQAPIHATKTF